MILDKEKRENGTNVPNKNNSLMLKMVTSYSIFLLAILILFFILFSTTFNNNRNVYNLQKQTTMISNVELFEKDIDIMHVYCRQMLQQKDFRHIMNVNTVTDKYMELGNQLQTLMATDIYPESLLPVNEVFCYFPLTEYILSPVYFIHQDKYYNWVKKYPSNLQDSWNDILNFSFSRNHYNPMDAFLSNSIKDYYLYPIDLSDLYYLETNAVICFMIDKGELLKLFSGFDFFDESSFLLIMDEDNSPVLNLGNLSEGNFSPIAGLNYKNNFSEFSSGITVGKYISDKTGYTYYYSFPAYSTTEGISLYGFMYVLVIVAALAGGGYLVYRFSRRNVEPILALGHELHEAVEEGNQLKKVMDVQRPIIYRSYVKKLLSGSVTTEEEAYYIMNYLNLPYYNKIFNVLYIVVYDNMEEISDESLRNDNYVKEMENIILSTLQKYFGDDLFYCRPVNRTFALLISEDASQGEDYILKLQEKILRIHDELHDNYDMWLFAGLGKSCDSPLNVWESYQQAQEAISYATKNYIFFPYEFIKKDSKAFYYPPEVSTKLIQFITTGNLSQVQELFSLIHQENIEERSLPINLIQFLLSDIRNTLLKARFTLPAGEDAEAAHAIDERFNSPLTFKLCEDIAISLCTLFGKDTEDENLAVTIEKYIQANFKDPSLCLNKISDEFQISESYFSHMFKEKTGANFSTYLENLRMGEAMRLIKETDISLNELYLMVGYNNPTTFRRAFKKVFGVTPSSVK